MPQLIERPSSNGHAGFISPPAPPSPKRRIPRLSPWMTAVAVAAILALIGGLVAWRVGAARPAALVTSPVTTGTLVRTATSSGTVNPQNTISVGTQDSGTISALYVDYNSKVKAGQILAKLDPTTFQAALAQARATLAQAEAQANAAGATAQGQIAGISVAQADASAQQATAQADQAAIGTAQATVTRSEAALTLAQQTLTRDKALLAQGFIAQATADSDQSNLVAAQTTLSAAQAALAQARSQAAAAVAQTQAMRASATQSQSTASSGAATAQANQAAVEVAQAQVQQAELNLQHTVITSPVDGIVVARDVSIGQTVAASLQTPTLFTIAQNLGKMEVDLAVGENDIGNVKAGDTVGFSVLAYPGRTFSGKVSQVRVNPTTTNNVVTYDTVVLVDNADGALLPGMTANASIDVAQAANATIVPIAALSWHPGNATGQHRKQGQPQAAAASPWGQTLGGTTTSLTPGARGRVFVDAGGKLSAVPVSVDLVSGTNAAVTPLRGTLAAGDQVVTASTGTTPRPQHAAAAQAPGGPGGLTRGLH